MTAICIFSLGIHTDAAGGAKNTEVIRLLVSIMCRNNVILLEGDQEKCLYNLVTGKEKIKAKSQSFPISCPPCREQGRKIVTKSGFLELYLRMEPCVCYNFRNKCVLVTHGGLSCLPENLIYVGTVQMINGVGEPWDAGIVAASFNRHTSENIYQVHGHRNPKNLPIENGRTFNLSCGG